VSREYDKLVRDKIPTIIEQNDETPITHAASEEEYGQRLLTKLEEEVREYQEGRELEELADIFGTSQS
jgi:predicted house-cleaning noncanonical NTP pyrophosphatase (MazG superfamily)